MRWVPDLLGTNATARRVVAAKVILAIITLIACNGGAESTVPAEQTRRVVILQGVCSSTAESADHNHWLSTIKRVLSEDHQFIDAPNGDRQDQIIEFGYSPSGWADEYEPRDTLRPLNEASGALATLYSEYPNSDFYLLGHSLGGMVALHYLSQRADPQKGDSSRIAGVLTVSSPLQGFDANSLPLAARAIELIACRLPPSSGQPSPIWADLASSGEVISAIRSHDWARLRVVNAVNQDDRVVDAALGAMPQIFDVACYSQSDEGFLPLNHDTLLTNEVTARELIDVLLGTSAPNGDC